MEARRAAAGLLGLEGTAGVVSGIGFVVAALVGDPADRGTAVFLGALLALLGAGVVAVARGVWRRSTWARTPSFLTQFFALVVAWYNRDSTIAAVSVLLAVVAVATVVALLWAHTAEAERPG